MAPKRKKSVQCPVCEKWFGSLNRHSRGFCEEEREREASDARFITTSRLRLGTLPYVLEIRASINGAYEFTASHNPSISFAPNNLAGSSTSALPSNPYQDPDTVLNQAASSISGVARLSEVPTTLSTPEIAVSEPLGDAQFDKSASVIDSGTSYYCNNHRAIVLTLIKDPSPHSPDINEDFVAPLEGDFKIKSHPYANISDRYLTAEEYRRESRSIDDSPLDFPRPPWSPYLSRLDFEVSKLMMDAGMNQALITRTIALFLRCQAHEDVLNLKSYSHVRKMWKLASTKRTGVRRHPH